MHVVGPATAQSPIQDFDVGIKFIGQVSVARTAEMYQWKESLKKTSEESKGGSTPTTQEWSEQIVSFEDHEDPKMPFRTARFSASDAKLGGWRLDPNIVGRIDLSQALKPAAPVGWTTYGDNYYRSDPEKPQVGNMRVRYLGLPSSTTISVLARQSGDGFATFKTKDGPEVAFAAIGNHSAAQLIETQRREVAGNTWVWRCVGAILLLIGGALAFSGF